MKAEFERVRTHIAARIASRTAGGEQYATAISGLNLYRHAEVGGPISCMVEPAIALPVQGAKRAHFGSETYAYDRHRFLITALDLPVVLQVTEASPASPYLSAVLKLDVSVIGELMMESKLRPPDRQSVRDRGMVLGETTLALLEAFDRLVGLLDEPELIPVLAPLVQREIFYRVLRSDGGSYLWQMASIGTQSQRVGRAIEWLKANFHEPLRIEELASRVEMSPSRFHHHFRQFTSMSPLQFQKWLRLTEARRLMVTESLDAAAAAYHVGYGSPSQFTREYARQFGTPPRRDVEGLLRQAGP
ncbi:AraC family transcriptional regulator [Aquabacterium sp.]|uniref:AraC family transcriptional regulator n=1 Tax=Aquabacterium sp. TaxID=1872578 RepID=UPI002BFFD1F1|nr:AraC family transcriptional regulator [Aquabacterium sp.]HSW03939.1 AraC family transcriptional regulator [Aquabacterium sp.]